MNVSEIAARLGRPITDPLEITQVNTWIRDANALVLARVPHVHQHIEDGAVSAEALDYVLASVVERKIKNPDGKQNERIDDYSYGLTEDAARGSLFLTDEELALLSPTSSTGSFTIQPTAPIPPRFGHVQEFKRA